MLKKDMSEELQKEIEKLLEKNLLVVVEGANDRRALMALGFEKIMTLTRKPLYKVVEAIVGKYKKVVILTDLDKAGKKLYARLKRDLNERGVNIDDRFRNFLFKETKLRQIEGLKNYLERNKTT